MRAVVVRSPAVPRSCRSGTCPIPSRPDPARSSSRWPRRRSTGPTCCSGRATTRRRPAPRSARAGVQRARSRGRRRRRRAGRSATRCAPCSRAAGTPSGSPSRPASCCRCPPGVELVEAAALPEVDLHGLVATSSCSPGCGPARRCSCTAGRAASARWRSSSPRRSARGSPSPRAAPEKLAACDELGATILVNYREQDFVAEVREATDGAGADVVLDNMGAKYLGAQRRRARDRAAGWSSSGMQGGTKAELNLGALMAQARRGARDVAARPRPANEKAAIVARSARHVWPLLARR